MNVEQMEKKKAPRGEVTLIGLGRLGFRTALTLMQVHRGGPLRITAIDDQKISPDDIIFRTYGGKVGEFKTGFLERLAGPGFSKEVHGIPENINMNNLSLVRGDVVCIEIAGGNTLPLTAEIIHEAQKNGASTISTMGVFGIGNVKIKVVEIEKANLTNPIVRYLRSQGVEKHRLIGTGKLIHDWEPVIPPVLDRISLAMASEILKLLHDKKI